MRFARLCLPPLSSENRGNFIDSGLGGTSKRGQKGHPISALQANSLRIRTGNFLPSCRELNRAIREIFALIRESRSRPLFWALAACRQIRSFRQISNVAEVRIPFSSTGERQTRQPDPAFCPAHLGFRYCSYGSMTYSNQFCLNEPKNSIFPLDI